jgi:catechol 2,3-dioxygenase-like lactoylglutathione lyase family enzyme
MELKAVHICLEVSDFKRAAAFWKPLLDTAGFAEGWSDGASYAGYTNAAMTLFFGESKPPRVVRAAPSGQEFVVTDHVGFTVGRREDVDAIAAAMAAAGLAPLFPAQEYPEFGPGFYAVTFRDADNNVIEFGSRAIPAVASAPQEP